jgi:putative membrane protein
MIVSNYPNARHILRQTGQLVITFLFLSIAAVLIDRHGRALRAFTIPEVAVSVLGAALGILLAFRTNSAYARWWEARTLWGALVNQSRSLARQVTSFSKDPEFAASIVYLQIAFVHSLRCALRRQSPWDEIRPLLKVDTLSKIESAQNVPNAILQQMGFCAAAAHERDTINGFELLRLDQTFSELSNVMGACERIKNTPLPRQYDFYPELFIKAYCFVLPFIIVEDVGLITPIVTVLIGFAFLVLNRIGKNLEDPFENAPYDVSMTALSRTIEINLRQMLGEKDVPAPIVPVNGVLM